MEDAVAREVASVRLLAKDHEELKGAYEEAGRFIGGIVRLAFHDAAEHDHTVRLILHFT